MASEHGRSRALLREPQRQIRTAAKLTEPVDPPALFFTLIGNPPARGGIECGAAGLISLTKAGNSLSLTIDRVAGPLNEQLRIGRAGRNCPAV